MSKVKAIIFDLNGILVLSEPFSKRIEAKFGVNADDFYQSIKEVMRIVRNPNVTDSFPIWKPHLDKLGLFLSRDEFFTFWTTGERVDFQAIELIKKLKSRRFRIFILSNNFRERTQFYRANFPQIFEFVDESYFSWETGFIKPDPQAFKLILDENSLKAEECVYFDDSSENVGVARSLGIHAHEFESVKKTEELTNRLA